MSGGDKAPVVKVGDVFGGWEVVEAAPPHPKHGWKRWKVRCGTCKAVKVRDQGDLRGGRTGRCKKCSWRALVSKGATCSKCGRGGHRADICPGAVKP